jgi:hypothetical protein
LLTLLLIQVAGHPRPTALRHAFFPLSLLRATGKICEWVIRLLAVMNLLFAGLLLWIILQTKRDNSSCERFSRSDDIALLACGGGCVWSVHDGLADRDRVLALVGEPKR